VSFFFFFWPLDPKNWHLWMVEEGKSKMVLGSILKIFIVILECVFGTAKCDLANYFPATIWQ